MRCALYRGACVQDVKGRGRGGGGAGRPREPGCEGEAPRIPPTSPDPTLNPPLGPRRCKPTKLPCCMQLLLQGVRTDEARWAQPVALLAR